jgi:gamma-glutamyltranspeptidase / glutathione hydrolase
MARRARERMQTTGGAVASPHHAASAVGREVLEDGGNALDAAIAVNAMLGVAYPHMCGLGGDLFLLYDEARTGAVHCVNGTGAAPRLATREAFRERGLDAVPARGALSVTVPGAVGAWDAAVDRFGSRPLGALVSPAIVAAEAGVEITGRLAAWIADAGEVLRADATLRARFLDATGAPLPAGATLRQPELAATLRRLARAGARDFYDGEVGYAVWRAVRDAGGLLRADDLGAYAPRWVAPIHTRHAGLDVLTTPPNSQGITALLMLDHLAARHADLRAGADYVHAFTAAKRAAFAVRDRYVTDPDDMAVPADELLREGGLVWNAAAPVAAPPVGGDTVYLCTADAEGNACSLIQSIYYGFGSGFVAGDTGVLLHNRGHYFSLEDDHPNRLEPGKRPLHTLMACMALEDGRPRFVFGTMGADGQPQTNVQVLHRLLAGAGPQEAVAAPRFLHGRFLLEDDPEILHVEADLDPATLAALEADVAALAVVPPRDERLGHAHAIAFEADGTLSAGADPRSDGSAEVLG